MNLSEFISEVLSHRFPGMAHKQDVSDTSKGYNFHCPFCGDTASMRKKPRGNIFKKSNTYKCFNDGCMRWMPVKKFIATFAEEYEIDITELDFNLDIDVKPLKVNFSIVNNTIRDYLEDVGVICVLPSIDQIAKRFSLTKFSKLSEDTKVYEFLSRRLIHHTPSCDAIYADSADDKVYLFNYDKKTGGVLSFSIRKIFHKSYKIYTLFDVLKNLSIDAVINDADAINVLSNYYNIMNVRFDLPIRITEGQFDSMFLYNSVAMQGVTKTNVLYEYIDNDRRFTFFDNDKAGMEESLKCASNHGHAFMWSLFTRGLLRKYNAESGRVINIKDVNGLYMFMNEKNGTTVKEFNEMTDAYYTKTEHDLFYI